jgi:hypothetical protein
LDKFGLLSPPNEQRFVGQTMHNYRGMKAGSKMKYMAGEPLGLRIHGWPALSGHGEPIAAVVPSSAGHDRGWRASPALVSAFLNTGMTLAE